MKLSFRITFPGAIYRMKSRDNEKTFPNDGGLQPILAPSTMHEQGQALTRNKGTIKLCPTIQGS
jgi:hypothetical protein